jgi:hypothetical protein
MLKQDDSCSDEAEKRRTTEHKQNKIDEYSYCVSGYYSSSCFYLKHIVSETGFCLRLQAGPIQLFPTHSGSAYLRTPEPAQDRIYTASTE